MTYKYSLRQLLNTMVEHNATDLLLSVGIPPQMRIDKNLYPIGEEQLTPEASRMLIYQVMNEFQQKRLEDEWEVDFSIGIPNLCRFRVNAFMQRGSPSAAFRRIPFSMFSFDELSLPPIAADVCDRPNGLVLVTGPTGSGKSTTLAAMIDRINERRRAHIITIEDPIEYLHTHKSCTVEQREVGTDTKSFHNSLRSILRQDPDIVLLGEMRDTESIQAALTIAETGHLCFTTLHTNSCAQTLSRIVDVFPGDKQQQVRTQLAMTLNCAFSQTLLQRIGGGLQLALEVMVATPAIRSMIRENKIHNIDNSIALGAKFGMQTMNQSLANLVKSGFVTMDEAMSASPDVDELRKSMAQN